MFQPKQKQPQVTNQSRSWNGWFDACFPRVLTHCVEVFWWNKTCLWRQETLREITSFLILTTELLKQCRTIKVWRKQSSTIYSITAIVFHCLLKGGGCLTILACAVPMTQLSLIILISLNLAYIWQLWKSFCFSSHGSHMFFFYKLGGNFSVFLVSLFLLLFVNCSWPFAVQSPQMSTQQYCSSIERLECYRMQMLCHLNPVVFGFLSIFKQ